MPPSQLRIRHQLPHRLRVDFGAPLSPADLRSLIWHLERRHPDALIRPASSRRGLVIVSRHPGDPLLDPLGSLKQLLAQPLTPIPAPPPTGWQQALATSKQRSRELLMVLAIAGWVLPILPGTPFFLLAWWMGWRPEAKGAPDGGDQTNAITSQGGSTRADRQAS